MKTLGPLIVAIVRGLIEALLGKHIEVTEDIQDADKIDADNPFASRDASEF